MDHREARRILGVDVAADTATIRAAYRSRARRLHPDAGGSESEMALLSAAYRALRDPDADHSTSWSFERSESESDRDELDDWPAVESHAGASLRRAVTTLVCLALSLVVVVFVAAIGYDWSLGTP